MTTNLKNSVGLLVIIGIIIMPFSSFVPKTKAQWDLGSGTNVSYESSGEYNTGSGGTSVSGYISEISPLVSALPGCTSAIGRGIKNLFSGGGSSTTTSTSSESTMSFDEFQGVLDKLGTDEFDEAAGTSTNLESEVGTALGELGVPITSEKLNTIDSKLDTLIKDTVEINTSTSAVDTNQNCLNAIGKAIVKMVIQEMTLSIVQWIQGGNDGGPMFVTNPGKFFQDIAKKQILSFGIEIQDPDKFPFGKAFMQNVANSYNRKFADNARYSLNEMIRSSSSGNFSDQTFKADFSKGGWGAWEAMTQVPANNPLGFQLIASNELGKRLEGTDPSEAQQKKDLLAQANGWLGDERCTDPWGVTKEEDDTALVAGVTLEEGSRTVTTEVGTPEFIMGEEQNYVPETVSTTYRRCKKWEYVTPGAVVGHALTKSMDNNENSLLDAETLNDAIAAILDAAMARFSSELTTKGLANISTDASDYDSFDSSQLIAGSGASTSQVEMDFSNPSNWLLAHPNFNIRNDFNQALIDEQRTYVSKLASYNTALSDLVTNIYQLDYCIPGPHPGWKDDSATVLSAVLGAIPAETIETVKNKTMDEIASAAPIIGVAAGAAIGAVCGSVVPGLGTVIGAAVGVIAGLVITWIDNNDETKKLHAYYAGQIAMLTGIHVGYDKDEPLIVSLESKSLLVDIMNSILERYAEVINNVYKPEYMPAVAPEAEQEFKKIPGYRQIIKNNKTEIAFRKGIITRMENLKQGIDDESIKLSDLDNPISPTMTEFARLSAYFIGGNDIANVDNLYKETLDKTDYVYNDLLKGPYGCENDPGHFPWWQIADTKRMTYYPLMVQGYKAYPQGVGGYTDSNGIDLSEGGAGPGFLSYVLFLGTGDIGNKIENLDVEDLFPIDTWSTSVGRVGNGKCDNPPDSWNCAGIFEKIIGIY